LAKVRYLPAWFPGTDFHKVAKASHEKMKDALHTPVEFVKKEMVGTLTHASSNVFDVWYRRLGLHFIRLQQTILVTQTSRPNLWTKFSGQALPSLLVGLRYVSEHIHAVNNASSYPLRSWLWYGQCYAIVLVNIHRPICIQKVTSTIHTFFLCMTSYPDIQKRAQEEIDAFLGMGRLPTLDDQKHLPYVEALVKEIIRWAPAVPQGSHLFSSSTKDARLTLDYSGLPHRLMQDDTYEGYFLPKDSIVIANIWYGFHLHSYCIGDAVERVPSRGLLRDSETYSDPMTFNPARFIPSDTHTPERDPTDFCFGFGRRCAIIPLTRPALSNLSVC
jgi:hypothetical protein